MILTKDELIKIKQSQSEKVQNWILKHCEPVLSHQDIQLSDFMHALDYINSEDGPKRLTRLSLKDTIAQSKEWLNRLNRRNKEYENYQETSEDIQIVQQLNNFYWVKLLSEQAYKREGFLMGHCVASYSVRGDSTILSLRDHKNKPHCTIEVCKGTIVQVKGKQNTMVIPKYQKILRDFVKSCGFKVDSYDVWSYGWLIINGALVQETELPDEVEIPVGVEVCLSKFAKLPRVLKSKSPVTISGQKNTDLSQWELDVLNLNNCKNVILPVASIKELNLTKVKTKIAELKLNRLSLVDSELVGEKLDLSHFKLIKSYVQVAFLNCKALYLTESKIKSQAVDLYNFSTENVNNVEFNSLNISHILKIEKEVEDSVLNKINLAHSSGVILSNEITKSWTWPQHWGRIFFLRITQENKDQIDFTHLKDVKQITVHHEYVVQGKENSSINVAGFLNNRGSNSDYEYIKSRLE